MNVSPLELAQLTVSMAALRTGGSSGEVDEADLQKAVDLLERCGKEIVARRPPQITDHPLPEKGT